jgi:hypothetical protein
MLTTRYIQCTAAAVCLQDEFELVGIVLGLACYNGVIIDAHLPLPAYKKLMGLVSASAAALLTPTITVHAKNV